MEETYRKLIDKYQYFVKWVLRYDKDIIESQRGRDFLSEIDAIEKQIREQETNEQPKRVSAEEMLAKKKNEQMILYNRFDSVGNEIMKNISAAKINIIDEVIEELQEYTSLPIEQEKPQEQIISSICPECMAYNKKTKQEITKCWNCGENYRENHSEMSREQEKPSEQSAEEFLKSLSIFSYSDIELIAPIMRKYASQKHPVTDDMISAKLDTVNFETSRERETAFDLLVWLRDLTGQKHLPTDEEIKKAAMEEEGIGDRYTPGIHYTSDWINGAKWMKEQIK